MSLTNREKEIALECAKNADMCTEEGSLVVYRGDVLGMFDLFLSRIREEQEAVAYLLPQFTGWSRYTDSKELADKVNGSIPLFTTQPSAPCDYSELVEALEELMNESEYQIIEGMPTPYRLMDSCNRAKAALANHAKRMKGEE